MTMTSNEDGMTVKRADDGAIVSVCCNYLCLDCSNRVAAAEREACAKILDPLGCSEACGTEHSGSCYTMLAAEIRARGEAAP